MIVDVMLSDPGLAGEAFGFAKSLHTQSYKVHFVLAPCMGNWYCGFRTSSVTLTPSCLVPLYASESLLARKVGEELEHVRDNHKMFITKVQESLSTGNMLDASSVEMCVASINKVCTIMLNAPNLELGTGPSKCRSGKLLPLDRAEGQVIWSGHDPFLSISQVTRLCTEGWAHLKQVKEEQESVDRMWKEAVQKIRQSIVQSSIQKARVFDSLEKRAFAEGREEGLQQAARFAGAKANILAPIKRLEPLEVAPGTLAIHKPQLLPGPKSFLKNLTLDKLRDVAAEEEHEEFVRSLEKCAEFVVNYYDVLRKAFRCV